MILVAGATGELGSAVVRALLAQGKPVRVLVRPSSSYEPLVAAGAEAALGDLKDPASLPAACQGIDTVITTANSARKGGDDNPQTVDLEGNRHLIDAAKAARVRHFIFVSVYGADPRSPIAFLAAKAQTEEYLKASGLNYTILAPNMFLEVWGGMLVVAPALAGQPVTVVGSGARKHSMISVADVLQFILASADNPRAINQKLDLGGPEAVSFRDLAQILGHLLGRELPVRSVQPGEPVPFVPETVLPLAIGLDTYGYDGNRARFRHPIDNGGANAAAYAFWAGLRSLRAAGESRLPGLCSHDHQ